MNPRQLQRQSRVLWFEIPATDLDRATRFYEQIFQLTLKKEQMGSQMLGIFTYEPPAISGCVVADPNVSPSNNGIVIYLNADPVLATVVDRVGAAGGKVIVPRVEMPAGMGVYAHILDTEGNRIGLHATE